MNRSVLVTALCTGVRALVVGGVLGAGLRGVPKLQVSELTIVDDLGHPVIRLGQEKDAARVDLYDAKGRSRMRLETDGGPGVKFYDADGRNTLGLEDRDGELFLRMWNKEGAAALTLRYDGESSSFLMQDPAGNSIHMFVIEKSMAGISLKRTGEAAAWHQSIDLTPPTRLRNP